jgi:hypothetical protein
MSGNADPNPVNYEFDDRRDAPPPRTEAEMAAAAAREEEERARRMGLLHERHAPAGRKWQDGIGGNSATGAATRLQEQEARLAKLKADAARAHARTLLIGGVLVVFLVAAGGVAADYTGLANLGIFPKATAEPVVVQAPVVAKPSEAPTPKPAPDAGEVVDMTPRNQPQERPVASVIEEPAAATPAAPVIDEAKLARAEEKIATAQRGIAAVQKDLDEVDQRIMGNLRSLYGVALDDPMADPVPGQWRSPCGMLELESANAASRPLTGAASIRLNNAQATVNNLTGYIARDRRHRKDVADRLKRPTADLQAAEKMKAEAMGTAPR